MKTPNTPEIVDYIQPTKFLDLHNNTRMQAVQLNGTYYLQAADVAEQLGYVSAAKLNQVFLRNPDEFDENDTLLATLETAGGPQKIRCYSLEGVYALGMLARTEPAKQFRRVVKKVMKELAITGRVVLRRYYPAQKLVERFARHAGVPDPFREFIDESDAACRAMRARVWNISAGDRDMVYEVDAGMRYETYPPIDFYFVRVDAIEMFLSRIFGDVYDLHAAHVRVWRRDPTCPGSIFHAINYVGIDYLRRITLVDEIAAEVEQRMSRVVPNRDWPRMTEEAYYELSNSDEDMPVRYVIVDEHGNELYSVGK